MSQPSIADRYRRLNDLLSILLALERFSLAQLREKCPQENPAFVTRLVRQLEREGHLRAGADDTFTWAAPACDFPAAAWLERKLYGVQLPRSPAADRPRERLLTHGAASLRTAELLAILIRCGVPGESALQGGEKIASSYGEQLESLPEAGRGELKGITATVGDTAYCQLMAGVELGRRVAAAQNLRQPDARRLLSSADALAFCRDCFARLASDGAQEEFHVVCLGTKNQVIGTHRISVGTLDRSLVHPREVFRPAIKDAAKSALRS
jgi:DNA repair protein RadC